MQKFKPAKMQQKSDIVIRNLNLYNQIIQCKN